MRDIRIFTKHVTYNMPVTYWTSIFDQGGINIITPILIHSNIVVNMARTIDIPHKISEKLMEKRISEPDFRTAIAITVGRKPYFARLVFF